MTNKVLIIHPRYAQLRFLGKLVRILKSKYSDYVTYHCLSTTDESHQVCLRSMRAETESLLIFLCHGTPKNLRGCNRNVIGDLEYHWGTFISPEINIDVFSNKRVICVACDSVTLAEDAIKAGAKVYIGFDVIRFFWTSENIQRAAFSSQSKRSNSATRYEFRMALEEAIVSAFENKYTFNQFSVHIRFSLQKRANMKLLVGSVKTKNVDIDVARSLLKIKEGIKLTGDGNLRVFSRTS